jgi:hypothetical protein
VRVLNNSPKVRAVIYWVTAVLGAVAVGLQAIPTPWADAAAEGLNNVAAYLATLVGITAVSNLTAGPDTRLLRSSTDT